MTTQDPFLIGVACIPTKSSLDHRPNGEVITILNENEPGTDLIEQVYLTVCYPGMVKGPHVHDGNKWDRFFCIEGQGTVVCRNEETKEIFEFNMNDNDFHILCIPPNVAHAIASKYGMTLLSMPSEGYKPGHQYNQREVTYEGYNWYQWIL